MRKRLILLLALGCLFLSGCMESQTVGPGAADPRKYLMPKEAIPPVEDYAATLDGAVPPLDQLVYYKDTDATRLVAGFTQAELFEAWGDSHSNYDRTSEIFDCDDWTFGVENGDDYLSVTVTVYYDHHADPEVVNEVTVVGPGSPYITGYTPAREPVRDEDGYFVVDSSVDYWPDMDLEGFRALARETDDPSVILDRVQYMTRRTVRDLLGRPECWVSDGTDYLGDLFGLSGDRYLFVTYDDTYHTLPVDAAFVNGPDGVPDEVDGNPVLYGAYNAGGV